jgi:hypothetical protein
LNPLKQVNENHVIVGGPMKKDGRGVIVAPEGVFQGVTEKEKAVNLSVSGTAGSDSSTQGQSGKDGGSSDGGGSVMDRVFDD